MHELLARSARRAPGAVAVEGPGDDSMTYRALDALSDRARDWLRAAGVRAGDRVGVHLPKSIDAVAALYGVLKAGAAYVPVDFAAPVSRSAGILADAGVSAVVVDAAREAPLREALAALRPAPPFLVLDGDGPGGRRLERSLDREAPGPSRSPVPSVVGAPDDLAYILFTSGSTGRPKGAAISRRAALAFVGWGRTAFDVSARDRLSSHAPFHFDLSIFDLYVSAAAGATVVLIGEPEAASPLALAARIAARRLTVWYSAPSALAALADFGRLERHDASALRLVLFAGEVFPARALAKLRGLWPHPAYANLYGPTETNVCTWYGVPPDWTASDGPLPIGIACPHYRDRIVDPEGGDLPAGAEGELCLAGDGVMAGYWGRPEETAKAFHVDGSGTRWYRTGDVVRRDEAGLLRFLGRRDRMVKRRGHRIELAEVEASLHRLPGVREAAVVAVPHAETVRIRAFLVGDGLESILALKQAAAGTMPAAHLPDDLVALPELPRTSTGKTDYQRLAGLP